MKKRLALLTVTAMTALGAAGSASAIIGNFPHQPHNGAPSGAQCGKGATHCTAGPSGQSKPIMNNANGNKTSTHGSGYKLGRQAAPAKTSGTNPTATNTGR